ncbi:unnamed protein product [Coregonus sp. 'balchen']|nr:unnamed protein product [Coregonus sp. 'balchen']
MMPSNGSGNILLSLAVDASGMELPGTVHDIMNRWVYQMGFPVWVLANLNVTGYYRVNYNLGKWEHLLFQLSAIHQVIPLINSSHFVDDSFNLARAKIIATTLALRTTKYLCKEKECMPLELALDNYGTMQTGLKCLMDIQTSEWNDPRHGLLGMDDTGVVECPNLTKGWYSQWMADPDNNL